MTAKELTTVSGIVCSLAAATCARPKLVIQHLTGVLWTEDEAAQLTAVLDKQTYLFDAILSEMINDAEPNPELTNAAQAQPRPLPTQDGKGFSS